MNNQRRKALAKLIKQLEESTSYLQSILDEEQDSFDNMPDSLQYSEKGERIEEAIDTMENACELISEATDSLKEL
jgi:hypothetical protein